MAFTVRWRWAQEADASAPSVPQKHKRLRKACWCWLKHCRPVICESFRVWYLQSTYEAVPSRVSRFVFGVYVVLRPRTWQESRQWWPRRFYERKLNWETSDSRTLEKPPHHHRLSTSPHATLHHFVLRSHISSFTCAAWSKRIGFWRFP